MMYTSQAVSQVPSIKRFGLRSTKAWESTRSVPEMADLSAAW